MQPSMHHYEVLVSKSFLQAEKTNKRKSVGGNKVPRGSLHKSRTLANKEHQ